MLSLILILSCFTACSNNENNSDITTNDTALTSDNSTTDGTTTDSNPDSPDDYVLRVGALKGPTGMGMSKLMKDNINDKKYEFSVLGSPQDMTASLVSKSLDIAAVPVNLAAVINKKTNGEYLVAAINTLGVLYILENGNTVNSISDLAGKKVYATGQASTPEYILNYILEKNDLENVEVEYKTEHAELATLMASGSVVLGMLPEPNVTTVLSKNSNVRIALNLTEEWKKVSEGESVQGCLVISKSAIKNHKGLVDTFLTEYSQSVDYVNNNVSDAANIIAELQIVPSAAIAQKAIPNCNIVYIDGNEMVSILTEFYKVLFDANPDSIGGALPNESLYYKK